MFDFFFYSIKMLLDECGVTLDSSGVKFLKQIAEVFVRNAVDSSYEIAKLHKGEKIDAKDLALHLSNLFTLFTIILHYS